MVPGQIYPNWHAIRQHKRMLHSGESDKFHDNQFADFR